MKYENEKKEKTGKISRFINIFIAILLVIAISGVSYLIIKNHVLPLKYLFVYFILFALVPLVLMYFSLFRKRKRWLKITVLILQIIYIIVLGGAFFYLDKTFDFVESFTQGFEYETKNYYILVLNNSEYNEIDNINNLTIGYTTNFDNNISKALAELDNKITITHQEYSGYNDLFNSLKNKEIQSILMIDSLYDMLKEENDPIINETKILEKMVIKERVNENIGEHVSVTEEPFILYVSGMDAYGNITDKNRSDVNIVISVNPKTHKVLMVNIPRDYYVDLAGYNAKDKLTHAGIYGIDTSIKTVENILDIKINYYVKVNYNALIKVVDALGGVDVYSNYDFHSTELFYSFHKGYNKVNGKQALDFVRTRKAFQDGDRVRGENQEAMIKAIIDKALSPSILIKYDAILKSLEGSFATNMSSENIMSLINMQLDKMPNWEITSMSVTGSDGSGITYSIPQMELYVMIPDTKSITDAKIAIAETLKEPKQEEIDEEKVEE